MEYIPNCTQKGSPASSNPRTPMSTCYKDEDETEPLTCPFFSVTLSKSHIKTPYNLIVPSKFRPILSDQVKHVALTHHGKTWEMDYIRADAYSKKFSSSWRNFAVDNNLKVGDGCVFELVHQKDDFARFKVQILRGEIPKEMTDKIYNSGGSADDPITSSAIHANLSLP